MKLAHACLIVPILLVTAGLAANPQDEQVVRNTYAKLAYAVQSKTVYVEAQKHPDITSPDLAKKLQANELHFEITEMSSGTLSDIDSKPYTDFVTQPNGQDVLGIAFDTETFDENGKRFTSYFAGIPSWTGNSPAQQDWDVPVKDALKLSGHEGHYSRYVTATITVSYQGRSRTYRTFWLFGSDLLAVDLVTGGIVGDFVTKGVYPSVLTDTSLRSRVAVSDWLTSTQRLDSSCKTGKQDVCCDSTMRCGVPADDLRSTKPAPNTTTVPKGGL